MSKLLDRVLDSMADRIARRVAAHNTVTKAVWKRGDLYLAVKTDQLRVRPRDPE